MLYSVEEQKLNPRIPINKSEHMQDPEKILSSTDKTVDIKLHIQTFGFQCLQIKKTFCHFLRYTSYLNPSPMQPNIFQLLKIVMKRVPDMYFSVV